MIQHNVIYIHIIIGLQLRRVREVRHPEARADDADGAAKNPSGNSCNKSPNSEIPSETTTEMRNFV